jgi:hypothetical protein
MLYHHDIHSHTSIAAVIRKALALLRASNPEKTHEDILTQTAGILRNRLQDGLKYQEGLRNEWRQEVLISYQLNT